VTARLEAKFQPDENGHVIYEKAKMNDDGPAVSFSYNPFHRDGLDAWFTSGYGLAWSTIVPDTSYWGLLLLVYKSELAILIMGAWRVVNQGHKSSCVILWNPSSCGWQPCAPRPSSPAIGNPGYYGWQPCAPRPSSPAIGNPGSYGWQQPCAPPPSSSAIRNPGSYGWQPCAPPPSSPAIRTPRGHHLKKWLMKMFPNTLYFVYTKKFMH